MKVTHRRLSFFLPNIFTALNLGCGFACIIFAMGGKVYESSMIILLGAIFDSVDGRVARMTGTQSHFGEQFDSVSDAISFGMAPSLMVYIFFLQEMGRVAMLGCFLFLLCGVLRLARFNANIQRINHNYFQGLPIPAAALGLAGLSLWSLNCPEIKQHPPIILGYIAFLSFLMISNIAFLSLKSSEWTRKYKKASLFIVFLIIMALFTNEEIMIGIIINAYILYSLLHFALNRKKMEYLFNWTNGEENEDKN